MGGLRVHRLGRPPHEAEAIQSPRCAMGVMSHLPPLVIPNQIPWSARYPVASIPRRWIAVPASWPGVALQLSTGHSLQPATTTVHDYAMGDRARATSGRPGTDHVASRRQHRRRQPSLRVSRIAACLGASCWPHGWRPPDGDHWTIPLPSASVLRSPCRSCRHVRRLVRGRDGGRSVEGDHCPGLWLVSAQGSWRG